MHCAFSEPLLVRGSCLSLCHFERVPSEDRHQLVRGSSQVLYELTTHLLMTKWRDSGEDSKLRLFGQLKRVAKQWLDGYLVCKGGTYPAQLKYEPARSWD